MYHIKNYKGIFKNINTKSGITEMVYFIACVLYETQQPLKCED